MRLAKVRVKNEEEVRVRNEDEVRGRREHYTSSHVISCTKRRKWTDDEEGEELIINNTTTRFEFLQYLAKDPCAEKSIDTVFF